MSPSGLSSAAHSGNQLTTDFSSFLPPALLASPPHKLTALQPLFQGPLSGKSKLRQMARGLLSDPFFIYLFLEKGREEEKHQCVVASRVPPTGDLA